MLSGALIQKAIVNKGSCNSPCLVKLYNKYIICFLSAGLFLQCVHTLSEFEAVNYW